MFGASDADGFASDGDFVQMLPGGVGHVSVGELNQRRVLFIEENLDAGDVAVNAE